MPVRGDRGFPPRRELSGWLRVSALRVCSVGRRLSGDERRARGGLPVARWAAATLPPESGAGGGARVDFTRPGGGSWPPGLLNPFLSSLKSLGFQIKSSGRVGDTVLNSVLDLWYLEGISSCLLCSLPYAFVSSFSFLPHLLDANLQACACETNLTTLWRPGASFSFLISCRGNTSKSCFQWGMEMGFWRKPQQGGDECFLLWYYLTCHHSLAFMSSFVRFPLLHSSL